MTKVGREDWLDPSDAQPHLSLGCMPMQEVPKSHEQAQMFRQ